MKTIKLTSKELNEAFPTELLSIMEPDNVFAIEQFKLKAMTKGVTSDEIKVIQDIMELEK